MELVSLFMWTLSHLASLLLILVVAYGAGDLFLRKVQFASLLERYVMTLTTGLGLCALALLGLGALGLIYRPLLIGLTVAGAIATLLRSASWGSLVSLRSALRRVRQARYWQVATVLVFFGYWLLVVLLALYPPIQWDATGYHLVHARDFVTLHHIRANPGVTWPILPLLNQLLFSWALCIGDDVLAQLIEHTFLMLTAIGLYTWGSREGRPLVGIAAAVMWLSHPLVLWLGSSAYVDVALTAFTFLGIYALRVAWDEGDTPFWLLGIVLLGSAAGIKISALAVLPVAACFVLAAIWMHRLSWRKAILALGLGVCVSLPWYVPILLATGNPVWPLFTRYSQGIWSHQQVIELMEFYQRVGLGKTPFNFLLAPVKLILSPARFLPDNDARLSPVLMLFPLCWVLMFRSRSVRWWTLWSSVVLVAWFLSSQQMRLLLPALPIAGLAITEGIAWASLRMRASNGLTKLLLLSMTAIFLSLGAAAAIETLLLKGLPPSSPAERERWLSKYCNGYRGVDYINRRAVGDDTVYLINAGWLGYHLKANSIALDAPLQLSSWPSFVWPDRAWTTQLRARGIDWILVNHQNAPAWMNLGKTRRFVNPFEPDYEPVYGDSRTWVFRLAPDDAERAQRKDESSGRIPCTVEGAPMPRSAANSNNRKWEGYLDTVNCEAIAGWVWDPARPADDPAVEVYADDAFLGSVVASGYRSDLEKAGKGDGRHAFTLDLPLCLQDGEPHSIRVTVAGTGVVLGSTPRKVICEN